MNTGRGAGALATDAPVDGGKVGAVDRGVVGSVGSLDGPASDSVAREMTDLEGETRTDEGTEDVRENGFDASLKSAAQLVGFGGGFSMGTASEPVDRSDTMSGGAVKVDSGCIKSSATEPKIKPCPAFLSTPILAISASSTPAAKTTLFPLAFPFPFAESFGVSSLTATCSVRTVFGIAPLNDEL